LLFIYGMFDRQTASIFAKRRNAIITAVLFSLGTYLLAIPTAGTNLALILPIISGIMTGIGSSYFLILWGIRFSRFGNNSIVLNSVISIVIAFVLYALVIQNLPLEVSAVFCGLIPLIELLIWGTTHNSETSDGEILHEHKFLPVKKFPVMVRFGIPIALFGIALGFSRTATTNYIDSLGHFGTSITLFLTVCVAALLTMFLYVAMSETSRWNSIFKLIVPCIAVAIFCIPLMNKDGYELSSLFVITGFILFECTMWIYFGFIAQKFNLSPIMTYGIGRGVLAFFSLFGTMIYSIDTATLLGLNSSVKMSAVLVILIIAYIALPDRSAIKQMRKYSLAPQDSLDDLDVDFDEEGGVSLANMPTGEQPKLCHNCIENLNIAATEQAPSQENAKASGALNNIGANEQTASAAAPKIDKIPQQVEIIANTYLLSRRETDVLECLARGRNSVYICKNLYIAEGTAKTHIRHVYRKLNVHSQGELQELVEQVEV
jgi:DNA-binding CsgD family transcriptional regulator